MTEDNDCIACLDNKVDTIFEKCNHVVLCKLCAAHIISLNIYSYPKCRMVSENILSFNEIEISLKDNESKQYKYKKFIDIIDFPIYYILKNLRMKY